MTRERCRHFEKLLVTLRDSLMAREPQRIEPNRQDEAAIGEDEDEQPLNEMLQSIASNRNRSTATTLARIENALKKLREQPDDFGLCEDCGDDVAEPRLEAMPYAELCVDCQAKRDPKGPQTRRNLYDFRS